MPLLLGLMPVFAAEGKDLCHRIALLPFASSGLCPFVPRGPLGFGNGKPENFPGVSLQKKMESSRKSEGVALGWDVTGLRGTGMGANAEAGERSGVKDLGDTMNCWAGDGQMERDLGGSPKIALFSAFGRVIALLITHMFWEWARGGFNRIRVTISALKKTQKTTPKQNQTHYFGVIFICIEKISKKIQIC